MKKLYLDMETLEFLRNEDKNKNILILDEIIRDTTMSICHKNGMPLKVRVYIEREPDEFNSSSRDELLVGMDEVNSVQISKTISGDYVYYGLSILHYPSKERSLPIYQVNLINENENTKDLDKRSVIVNWNEDTDTLDISITNNSRIKVLTSYTTRIIDIF